MRVINSQPDKFLIQCIELDLYDLIYRNVTSQLSNHIIIEASDLLDKYVLSGAIRDFNVIGSSKNYLKVEIFTPRRVEIVCQGP